MQRRRPTEQPNYYSDSSSVSGNGTKTCANSKCCASPYRRNIFRKWEGTIPRSYFRTSSTHRSSPMVYDRRVWWVGPMNVLMCGFSSAITFGKWRATAASFNSIPQMWIWLNRPDPCNSLAKSYGNDVVPTSGAAPENTKKKHGD